MTIKWLKENYPQYKIGYSDNTIGISAPIIAVALGAEIIEKHVTIDRYIKGTGHILSLGPEGVYRMIRDIRLTGMFLGGKNIFICSDTDPVRLKLERSVASKRFIKKGETIYKEDLHMLSPGSGLKCKERFLIFNKIAKVDIPKDEHINLNIVE